MLVWGRGSAPSKPSEARQLPVDKTTPSPLGALDQRVPRRNQPGTVQLSSEAVFVIGSGSSGQALAQLRDLLCASAAPANFRTTAGCGHEVLLSCSVTAFGDAIAENHESDKQSVPWTRVQLNYRVDRHGWQRHVDSFGQEPRKGKAPCLRQFDAAPP